VEDRRLRLRRDERPYHDLVARYHTPQHIEECRRELDASRHLAEDPVATKHAAIAEDPDTRRLRGLRGRQGRRIGLRGTPLGAKSSSVDIPLL
jgi:hypothetical protein